MVTLGISTWSIHRTLAADPARLIDVPATLRAHGLTDLQICHFQLPSREPKSLRELRTAIESNGVTLDALLIDFGDLSDTTQGDADARAIEEWLGVAAALGARFARVSAGSQPPTEETLRRSAGHLLRLSDAGEQLGVRVITENWHALVPGSREALRLIELTEGRVPLCLDFGNWQGETKYDGLRAIAPHAVTVHAKCAFDAAGTPDAEDYARCFEVLKDSQYAGTVALIYDGPPDDEWRMIDVERDLAHAAFGA